MPSASPQVHEERAVTSSSIIGLASGGVPQSIACMWYAIKSHGGDFVLLLYVCRYERKADH